MILPHHILLYPRLVPPALLPNPPTCAPVQVATNWKEEGRNETSPENDYTNNEASVPIEISGMSVRALPDSEVLCGMLNGWRLGGATAHWAVATCVGLTLNRLLAPVAHAHLDKRRRA